MKASIRSSVRSLAAGTVLSLLLAGLAGAQALPGRTVTVVFPGFDPDGASATGEFGVDEVHSLLDEVAALAGVPTILDPGGPTAPDLLTGCAYYGSVPPPYYTAQDLAELDAVTAQYGGGVPRYALICAKFIREVLRRTGAEQVNVVGPSFGAYVTRWMLANDLEGLMSSGRVARWITYEGVVTGNWGASQGTSLQLGPLEELLPIDLEHMSYDWCRRNVHDPCGELDDPLFATVQIGHQHSTRDTASQGALTAALLLLEGRYRANDGVVLVEDGALRTVTPRSRFLGREPTRSYTPVDHDGAGDHPGVWAHAATLMSASRRVTITLKRAVVGDLYETFYPWNDSNTEVVFEASTFSPRWETRWGIQDAVSTRDRRGVVTPVVPFHHAGAWEPVDLVLFDDFVLDDETQLRLELGAEELDWEPRYGVFEVPFSTETRSYARGTFTLDLDAPGTTLLSTPDWTAEVELAVQTYPTGKTLWLPGGAQPTARELSLAGGGDEIELALAAGPNQAGLEYLVLGSASGTMPGTPLPGVVLPLNLDAYTHLVLATLGTPLHEDFRGTLDGAGRASAVFHAGGQALPAELAGLTLHYAALVHDGNPGTPVLVTNPVAVALVP